MFVAILAVGLVAAAAAMAEPEFRSSGTLPTAFTGTSGLSVLAGVEGSGNVVECKKDTASGSITSATLAGGIVVHFLECEGSEGGKTKCPVMSSGAPTINLIQTTTLHGVLGLALLSNSTTVAGLLLLPVSGKRFVTLLSAQTTLKCVEEIAVTGTVAGSIEPVEVLSTTGKLKFIPNSVKTFDLTTGGSVKPALVAFGGNAATEETTEELSFGSTKVEVT